MGEVFIFLINYGIGVWMGVFYEIDIVVYKRLLDFFFMECKYGSRILNLLLCSICICRVEVFFIDRIEGKKKFRCKNIYFFGYMFNMVCIVILCVI